MTETRSNSSSSGVAPRHDLLEKVATLVDQGLIRTTAGKISG
ncbi:hypothetical protein [Vreelandella nigrificans]|nr:hypothetical protein [Halomonas nigrificans]